MKKKPSIVLLLIVLIGVVFTAITLVACDPQTNTPSGENPSQSGDDPTQGGDNITTKPTVTMELNGGSISGQFTLNEDGIITEPAKPTKDGYIFIGWYKDSDCKTVWNFDIDKVSKNITLYAKWDVPTQGLAYELNPDGESYALVGMGTATTTDIVVPNMYNDKPVTVVGSGNLWNFYQVGVTSFYLPDTVTSISANAFNTCIHITSINLPSNLTQIGDDAFSACLSLQNITVDKANKKYHSAGNCVIETATNTLVLGCKGSIIPSDGSVTKIEGAFAGTVLNDIDIPNTVTEIGKSAFSPCFITRITIPESVTLIDDTAFSNCPYLVEVCNKSKLNIVKGADTFGAVAKNARNVYTPTNGKSNIITKDDLKFYSDENGIELLAYTGDATEIVLPQEVNGQEYTIIQSPTQSTFQLCPNLHTITIPDFITIDVGFVNSFGFVGWDNCCSYGNRNIIVRGTNPNYSSKDGVLYNKDKSEIVMVYRDIEGTIIIPDSVTTISQYAFNNCNKITSITIGSGLTSIDSSIFSSCQCIESITVSSNNAKYYSEGNCIIEKDTKSLVLGYNISVIPSDIISIGDRAFLNCSGITSVTIPNSVTSIGESAFCAVSSLTSVTIGDGVTSIGSNAFQSCYNLTGVYYMGNVAGWCNINFDGWQANPLYYANNLYIDNELVIDLIIPDTVTEIKSYVFENCTSMISVMIPDSVTEVYDGAFYGCCSLRSVYYKGTADDWGLISIGHNNNSDLTYDATRYYYSESEPELNADGTAYNGNYWYYNDDNEIVVWTYKKENN